MTQLTLIASTVGLFVAGFVAWYTMWHRKVESCFERVPVGERRTVHLVRQDVALDEVLDTRLFNDR
jgi:hypothetical protein